MGACVSSPGTWKAEAGRSLVLSQAELYREALSSRRKKRLSDHFSSLYSLAENGQSLLVYSTLKQLTERDLVKGRREEKHSELASESRLGQGR